MSYIGTQLTHGQYTELDDISGGFNNSTTSFTLSAGGTPIVIGSRENLLIQISAIMQLGSAFTVTGSGEITFSSPPLSTDTFKGVLLGHARDVGVPTNGSVTTTSLSSDFFVQNPQTFNNINIPSGKNAMAVGGLSISGTLTIPSGSTFVVL